MGKTFYITTPIYYPNGEPHLGHVYTTIAADVVARYHRLVGDDTFFLTGTDEHGIKMVKTAAERGIEPRELADQNVAVFEALWKEIGITHDDFLHTTQPRHKEGVQRIVSQLIQNGDIYPGSYQGWYDEGQEEFVTETEAKNAEYKSAITGRPLTRYAEKSYFFRLAKYATRVLQYIEEHPEFIEPATRRNEVLSKLKAGVEDLSISRSTLKWGIPMPHDPEHVVYVWIDALSNYITALGYGSDDPSRFEKYWPADVHLIGKEIMWFHTVYWPAILFSLGLEPPKKIFAHGWWTSGKMKMSKSLGNFIDLQKLRQAIALYSLDGLRYYLLRAAPFGSDLDWTDADVTKSYNELGNVLGNCLNRTMKMINQYLGGVLPERPSAPILDELDRGVIARCDRIGQDLADAYGRLDLQACVMIPIELARQTNGYIDATAPFKMAKDPAKAAELRKVLWVAAMGCYRALAALLPVAPQKARLGLEQLGVSTDGLSLKDLLVDRDVPAGGKVTTGQPLFPKVEEA